MKHWMRVSSVPSTWTLPRLRKMSLSRDTVSEMMERWRDEDVMYWWRRKICTCFRAENVQSQTAEYRM